MKQIIVIGGPTASGKSALAMQLARSVAHSGGAVIINGDSQQIYAEIPIITAQPSAKDMAEVPHALYGHVSVAEDYHLGRWLDEAAAEIGRAQAAGKLPIVVGGTGMYLRGLVDGVADVPPVRTEIRDQMRALLQGVGNAEFHAMLKKRDAVMAARLEVSDSQRMLRAMEVLEETGQSLSAYQDQPHKRVVPEGACRCVRVLPARDVLYNSINSRFASMVEGGGLDEVRALHSGDVSREATGMKALGVPELLAHLDGEVSLQDAIDTAQMHTRRYAKRQMTWFRNQAGDWPIVNNVAEITHIP